MLQILKHYIVIVGGSPGVIPRHRRKLIKRFFVEGGGSERAASHFNSLPNQLISNVYLDIID